MTIKTSLALTGIIMVCQLVVNAQTWHEDVFPELEAEALNVKLVETFTPTSVIDYAFARDTLFLKIDAVNRNLSCIYTGLTLPIPEGSDPTQAVFLNGDNNGINTEHTFPLSLGTENTPAESDMHHLFPSRVKTNGDRANLRYGESPDHITNKWYRDVVELNSKPTTDVDAYSELQSNNLFEPRESVKGDIARAMFYIFTIYKPFVSEDYFTNQKSVLCDWHFADPVDEKEWQRTKNIAKYQGNENPFVLDCSVAQRLYCTESTINCIDVYTEDESLNLNVLLFDALHQQLVVHATTSGTLYLYTIDGELIKKLSTDNWNLTLDLHFLPCGNYIAQYTSAIKVESLKIQILK